VRIYNNFKEILSRPYPEESGILAQLKSSALIGFFIFLFLYLFKPFGLQTASAQESIVYSFYFGFATFLLSFLNDLFMDHVLGIDRQSEHWTFGKWLLSVLVLLVLIACANYYILTVINEGMSLTVGRFLNIAYITFLVGMFPVGFFGFLFLEKTRRQNENVARSYNKEQSSSEKVNIEIQSDTDEVLVLDTSEFLYAEAMQNYTALFVYASGALRKEVLRLTLKRLEAQLSGYSIIRCHRSYMVNKQHIEDISGNTQGLKLTLKYTETIVPVSRSYVRYFRQ